ncbi:MAG: hypothetical protein GC161_12910 [Planctomycetaceae bacterium]|nr:hypothetical protein [Planctomycetaceae bacterium]
MANKLLRRFCVVSLSAVAGFAVLELAARAILPAVPPRGDGANLNLIAPVDASEVPGLHWALRPRAEASTVYPADRLGPARRVEYRTNSHRFRGPEIEVAKRTAGEPIERWAILGDSFVFGTGVNEAGTLSERLQAALIGRGRRAEVWNWGVYAYNAAQSVALLGRQYPRLRPDGVLFVLYINDASGAGITAAPTGGEDWRADWVRRLGLTSGVWGPSDDKTGPQAVTMALRRHSRIIDHLAHGLHRSWIGALTRNNYRRDWSPGSPGYLSVRQALRDAKQLAQEGGFHLEVTMYPDLVSLGPPYAFQVEHDAVAAMCADLGLVFHDLVPAFEGLDGAQLVAHTHDHHPSGATNRVAAEYLADRLRPDSSAVDVVLTGANR